MKIGDEDKKRTNKHFFNAVKKDATEKFGREHQDSIEQYMSYWTKTEERNRQLLCGFMERVDTPLRGKRVLDVGSGTAGLSRVISNEGGYYVGLDYYAGIMTLANAFIQDLEHSRQVSLVRASAHVLPFQNESFDYVVAFDAVEHLSGGEKWQLSFFQETRRVLKDEGIFLLTTPNWLAPKEGHTFLFGPQYLPTWLADIYIAWRSPGFLKEHGSYANIHLLTPWRLQSLLRKAGLALLHNLPWCMEFEDYPPMGRAFYRVLSLFNLHWCPVTGFWCAVVKKEMVQALRPRVGKQWLRN